MFRQGQIIVNNAYNWVPNVSDNFFNDRIQIQQHNQREIRKRIEFQQQIKTQWLFWTGSEMLYKLQSNAEQMKKLENRIDNLNERIDVLNSDLSEYFAKTKAETKLTLSQDNKLNNKRDKEKKSKRNHYRVSFMERIFGVRDYNYKISLASQFPSVLYKQRNVSFKVVLIDFQGQRVHNSNALSLNLKVFYSNGQQVQQTKRGKNFIKGSINCLLMNGEAQFKKVYPRQVSKKLSKQKLCIVIYVSAMGQTCSQGEIVLFNQIQPLIIYGVKVVTKQNQKEEINHSRIQTNQSESQFFV